MTWDISDGGRSQEVGSTESGAIVPPRATSRVRLDEANLFFLAHDGREWSVVDAVRADAQLTILAPGSGRGDLRIFKPRRGSLAVYVFAPNDDHSTLPDVLEAQLAKAALTDGETRDA